MTQYTRYEIVSFGDIGGACKAIFASGTTFTEFIPEHAAPGAFGSDAVGDFIKDAIDGTDSVDIVVAGDSNTGFEQYGWVNGLITGLCNIGVTQYATPMYSVWKGSSATELGCTSYSGGASQYGMRSFGTGGSYPTSIAALDGIASNVPYSGNSPTSIKNNFSFGGGVVDPFGESSSPSLPTSTNGIWVSSGSTYSDFSLGIIAQTAGTLGGNEVSVKTSQVHRVYYATDASGGIIHLQQNQTGGSTPGLTTVQRNLVNTNSELGWVDGLAVSSDAARTNLQLYCAGGGFGASKAISGPVAVFFQTSYRPSTKGFAVNSILYRGGATMTNIADVVSAAADGYIKQYLKAIRERQISAGGTGRVIIMVQGGVNTDSGVPESWATNMALCIASFSRAWAANGYPSKDLAFVGMVSHQTTDPDGMANLRTRSREMVYGVNPPSNLAVFVLPDVVNVGEMASYYKSAVTDKFHLNKTGYNVLGERIARSLADFQRVTLPLATGIPLPVAAKQVYTVDGADVGLLS